MNDWSSKDVINAREMYSLPKKLEPRIDEPISKIVGKKVLSQDPRLIGLIVKFQRLASDTPDNLLENSKFISELKQVFEKPL